MRIQIALFFTFISVSKLENRILFFTHLLMKHYVMLVYEKKKEEEITINYNEVLYLYLDKM